MRRIRMWMMVTGCAIASAALAVPVQFQEGDLRGFPSMMDLKGNLLGKGHFAQWVDDGGLHVKATYDQLNGDVVEEATTLTTAGGDLAQRAWSWQRKSGGQVVERYSMDFDSNQARALMVKDGKRKEQHERLEVEPGRTFAGIGFVYALRNLYPGLAHGERVEMKGIAFTPKPREAKVTVSSVGVETVWSGGRSVRANHLLIHPEVPKLAKAFVDVPDTHLWFASGRPPAFLRAELKMQSLGMVRIDSGVAGGPPAAARRPSNR